MSSSEGKPESKFDLFIKKATPVFLLGHIYLFYLMFTYNMSTYAVQIHIMNYLFIIFWPLINIVAALALLVTMRWRYFSINTMFCVIAILSSIYLPLYLRQQNVENIGEALLYIQMVLRSWGSDFGKTHALWQITSKVFSPTCQFSFIESTDSPVIHTVSIDLIIFKSNNNEVL